MYGLTIANLRAGVKIPLSKEKLMSFKTSEKIIRKRFYRSSGILSSGGKLLDEDKFNFIKLFNDNKEKEQFRISASNCISRLINLMK